jgi:hypothetical protein
LAASPRLLKLIFVNRITAYVRPMPRKPIELPSGRKLVTLKDAETYISGLPKKESALPEWQTAIEVLMLCSRGGDPMMADIGFMKAPHLDRVREFNSDRKETHRGKRKLKLDE